MYLFVLLCMQTQEKLNRKTLSYQNIICSTQTASSAEWESILQRRCRLKWSRTRVMNMSKSFVCRYSQYKGCVQKIHKSIYNMISIWAHIETKHTQNTFTHKNTTLISQTALYKCVRVQETTDVRRCAVAQVSSDSPNSSQNSQNNLYICRTREHALNCFFSLSFLTSAAFFVFFLGEQSDRCNARLSTQRSHSSHTFAQFWFVSHCFNLVSVSNQMFKPTKLN